MTTSKIVRPLCTAIAAMTVTASFLVLGTAPAHASNGGIFIACADANSTAAVSIAGGGCTSLATALNSAVDYGSRDTVELMPGDYCPITVPPETDLNDITLIGVGPAGLAPADASFSGPEAALSSFDLDATTCGEASAPTYELNAPGNAPQSTGSIALENLGFDGTAAGGPANGLNAFDTSLSLNDVLIENFTQTGLHYTEDTTFANAQAVSLSMTNSAALNNATGVYMLAGNTSRTGGSIDDSLMAGNQTGLVNAGYVNLNGDTISHNTGGVDESNTSNSTGQTLYTIVADNTTDCVGTTGSFEPSGGFNGDNLVDSTCTGSVTQGYPDQTPTTVAPVALVTGAPTPSIVPPSEAIGKAGGNCGSNGLGTATDQIEDLVAYSATCDIGSIQSTNVTTSPVLASSEAAVDAGSVPVNQTFGDTIYVGNSGGGLLGTSSIATTGDSVFGVSNDSCTYQLALPSQYAEQCSVSLTATPTTVGAHNTGDLNIVTTAGTLDLPLTMDVVGPFTPPTDVAAVAGDGEATLSFSPPQSPTAAITGYDVQQSADGGQSWSQANAQLNSSGLPTSVTNLNDGTAYEFEIAAQDQYGDSPWSAPSAAVTPSEPLDFTALSAPKAATIKDGGSVRESTTLTDTSFNDTKMVGETVTLTANGSTTGVHATTNSQGVATVTVHPTANTHYTWRYAGDSEDHKSSSASALVTVEQVVHASLSHKKVKHGKATKVFGTVSPSEAGKTVTIDRLVNGKWKQLGTAKIKRQTLPNGKKQVGFVLTYKPARKGDESLRVVRAATSSNAGGVSKPLKLKVT